MLDAYRDLIDGLTEESTTLRDLLGDPAPDDLNASALAQLRTMRGREQAMLSRAQAIMRGDNVMLRSIDREPAVLAANTDTTSPEAAAAAFIQDRGELVSLLMNLTIKDWERKVNHMATGETTMSEEIEDHLAWEEDAFATLARLVAD